MQCANKYYYKIYKQTNKLTKKLFNQDVTGALHLRFELKSLIEKKFNTKIEYISIDDLMKQPDIRCQYVKYKTLNKILEILESACTFSNFSIEEFENEC